MATSFEWAVDFVLRMEGGFQNHPRDPGNYRPDGTLVGTKYGISARSYPNLDIENLTKEQAGKIYKRDYWDKLPIENETPRVQLAVFDFGVNAGVSRATQFWNDTQNFHDFMAERLRFYTKLDSFKDFGKGWINRTADLIDYVSDSESISTGPINASRGFICIREGVCFRVPFAGATVVDGKLYFRLT